jgi:hypothetical protein
VLRAFGQELATGVGDGVMAAANLTTPEPLAPDTLATVAPAETVLVSGSKAAKGPAANERTTTAANSIVAAMTARARVLESCLIMGS